VEQPILGGYDFKIIDNTKACQGKRWGIGNALSDPAHPVRANQSGHMAAGKKLYKKIETH